MVPRSRARAETKNEGKGGGVNVGASDLLVEIWLFSVSAGNGFITEFRKVTCNANSIAAVVGGDDVEDGVG